MTKKKKVLIITLSAIGAVITAVTAVFFGILFAEPAAAFLTELIVTRSAKVSAAAYVREKYGDSPLVHSAEPVYSGGFMFDNGSLRGAVVHFNGFDALVVDDKITDNRQYDEIVAAFTEEYLADGIYSEVGECAISFDFGVTVSSRNYSDFNSRRFDGDIAGFLGKTNPKLTVYLEGRGFHEKRAETPVLLREMLERIKASTGGDVRVYAYVTDPELDLPDMPMEETSNYGLRYPPKRYDDYMELIAAGTIDLMSGRITVEQPSFYVIDEFTAISDYDFFSPITSEKDFFLTAEKFPENTTALRGRFRSSDDEMALTIREDGLYCGVADRRHDYLLRLDREHYGITDSTVALRVARSGDADEWRYISFGYDGYDTDEKHWYYMDDKYLYLYVPHLCTDLFFFDEGIESYIAFADIEGESSVGE